MSEKKPVY